MPDEPASPPPPPPTFDVLKLSAEVRRAVDELGYVHPTPVQRAVFDPVSRGLDLVVQARTGTGKTAAYGLPVVDAVVRRNTAAVQVLVLCPTRELALQVARELESLAKYRGTKIAAVYGGAPMPAQIQKINAGAQIVAGTPGRVLDHLRRGTLDPKGVRAVVLDESDEMLSMGFLPQIDDILAFLPATRQTLLFSATLPPEIQRLAETRLKNPEFVTLSGDHVGALEISHCVYISRGDKTNDLLQVLEVDNPESAIIFCNTKESTKRVASTLQQQGFDAEWLNADLGQAEREKVMEATRKGKLRFLVATDVAARGIDISHLTHVINYDFPESCEQYVHRTGRTGRAGKTGTAISLVEASDIGNLYMLRLTYKIRPVEKELPTPRDLKTRAETDIVQMFAELFAKQPAHPDDLALSRRVQTHENAEAIIAGLLRDHLGARPAAADQAAAARRSMVPRPVADGAAPQPTGPGPRREARREAASRPNREHPKNTTNGMTPREPIEDVAAATPPSPGRSETRASPEPRQAPEPPRAEMSGSVRDPGRGTKPQPADRRDAPGSNDPGRSPESVELFVGIGRKDGARASDFYAALDQLAGITIDDTEYVNVRQRHTFIGLRQNLVQRALDALNGAVIAGRPAAPELSRSRS